MGQEKLDRQRWLEQRKTGIGASEAAVVLGLSPWKSPLELWAEKRGLVDPEDLSGNEAVQFGLKLEQLVLDELAQRTGRRVQRHPQHQIVRHPQIDWLICTPDAFQWDDSVPGKGVVQAKTTSAYRGFEWDGDEPPLHYQVQIQHEMLVTGCRWGTLCCLIGGQRFVWFDVKFSEKFARTLVRELGKFWNMVQDGIEPPPDGSEGATRVLEKLHPEDNGETAVLGPEFLRLDEQLQQIKDEIAQLEQQKRDLENKLRAAIGDCTYGVMPDGTRYSYKTVERSEYTVPARKYRVLRRLKS